MNVGSRLTVKAYPVTELCYGEENRVTVDGRMTVCKNIADKILAQEPLIREIDIRIIMPDEHRQHTNTVMDVIPLATKVLGRVGEGILEEKIAWGRAGTPLKSDMLISFDVVLKEGSWADRPGPEAAHRACDTFCQIFRDQMKKFNGYKCAEKHVFQETYAPGKKDVYIVKEVSGQGAVYDTRMFGHEPCGFEGGKSVIDMGCMPALVTPNEFRDGIMRAMD